MAIMTDMMEQAEADLKEAEATYTAAQSRAVAAHADAEAARERVREMHAVREWLRSHSQPPRTGQPVQAERTEASPVTRFGRPVTEVAQTDLCLQALESLGGTASNKQIRDRLRRDGHDLDLDKVRNSLKYLSRKTPAPVETDNGSGLWRLLHASTPNPFASAGTLPMNGAGGES